MQREQSNPGLPRWAQGDDISTSKAPDVVFNFQGGPHEVVEAVYWREVIRNGYRFARVVAWPTAGEPDDLLDLEGLAFHESFGGGSVEVLLERDSAIVRVRLNHGRLDVWISAGDLGSLEAIVAELRDDFPPHVPDPEAPEVSVTFWASSAQGPVQRARQISVPPWATIREHYLENSRRHLDTIMGDTFTPGVGGQLFMWDGEPGTGKTYALRALAWEWREWCDVHYITDPEMFFGEKANYMLEVLLSGDDSDAPKARPIDDDEPEPEIDPRAASGRWKLLVLEDTGELMSKDARERSGQGLSRLLNVVDGLIGQGLRVLVLVTTNEDLKRLHDAVSRPGRCASRVKFAAFPPLEASEWLAERDRTSDDVNTALTLAELFARLTDRDVETTPAGVGFVS